jgi:Camelysin metallo-endopeptidase
MCRRSLRLLILAGILAAVSLTIATALFTSVATIPNNAFTTGTLEISAAPASALVTYTNMAPGDQVTQPLTITNAGSLPLAYAMTTTVTADDGKGLANQLTLMVKSDVADCSNAGWSVSGYALYSGALASAYVGDPVSGAGDRQLAAGESEVLCFHATLPLTTTNTYQQASTTVAFVFNASSDQPPTATPAPTAAPTATPTPVNLVQNPGFETGTWTGWSVPSCRSGQGYWGLVTNPVHTGHYAVYGPAVCSGTSNALSQTITWGGGDLMLSAWVFNMGNNPLLCIDSTCAIGPATGGFAKQSVTLTGAAAGTHTIYLAWAYASAYGYYDDVCAGAPTLCSTY